MEYILGNVMSNYDFKADVIVAFNFSYFYLKKDQTLLNIFTQSKKHLKKDGAFFLDLFGGTEARQPLEESVKHKNHTYYWDCDSYNPLTAECLYYIHFKTHKDQVNHEKVFTYDWRMWDARELQMYWQMLDSKRLIFTGKAWIKMAAGNGVF